MKTNDELVAQLALLSKLPNPCDRATWERYKMDHQDHTSEWYPTIPDHLAEEALRQMQEQHAVSPEAWRLWLKALIERLPYDVVFRLNHHISQHPAYVAMCSTVEVEDGDEDA